MYFKEKLPLQIGLFEGLFFYFLHPLCLLFDFYFLNNALPNAVASVAQECASLSKIAERLGLNT